MIAVDTNVLARYLLNDDFEQAKAAARRLAGRELIDVPLSVWLEAMTKMAAKIGASPRVTQP